MEQCKKCNGTNLTPKRRCRDCLASYMRGWNARNQEKVRTSKQRRDPAMVKAERDRDRAKHRAKRYASRDASQAKKPEHYRAYKKAWYEANKEKCLKQTKARLEAQRAADPVGFRRKIAERAARRRRTDPQYLIYGRISSLMRQHLKRTNRDLQSKAGRQWTSLVGYTLDELIEHLKTTMPQGYTWADYLSAKLEVDHIVPDEKFDYRTVDDPGFKASWALTNLRLLTQQENSARRYV